MDSAIQIGSKSIDTPTLVRKLLEYRLLEKFVQESVIDDLIESVNCEPTAALKRFCQVRQLETGEQRQAWCKKEHFTPAQMEAEAVREFRLAQFMEETWGDRIQTFFLQRKAQLDRVVYSLIRLKSADVAQELYFRLCDDGDSFSDIARDYSEGKEAQTGGLVGPVELGVPHPTIGKMLQVSKESQLWPPTQIGEWIVIVRFEKRISAQLDDAMRQRLLHEQFQKLLQEKMQKSPIKLLPKQDTSKENDPSKDSPSQLDNTKTLPNNTQSVSEIESSESNKVFDKAVSTIQ
ncbi:MAG: peptidylprolyl isomerase [Cyanobacteria bacterium P01_D01_bin.36]